MASNGLHEEERALILLAQRSGVQTKYKDALGATHRASADTLLAVLKGLGVDVGETADAPRALIAQGVAAWRTVLEPVTVLGLSGGRVSLRLRMRVPEAASGPVGVLVTWEGGGTWGPLAIHPVKVAAARVGGDGYQEWQLVLPLAEMSPGYHRVAVEVAGLRADTLLIAHPGRAAAAPVRQLGLFVPPYALAFRGQALGSYAALAHLARWAGELPALVGTLPLLPTWLDGAEADHSPYRPITRLYWNEVYAAAADGESSGRQVDWPAVGRARLAQLEREWHGSREGAQSEALPKPPREYAAFRAYYEAHPTAWHTWPEAARAGRIPDGAVDPERVAFYQYAAARAEQGMRAWAQAGERPLLDFPVGVHPAGYDTWRWPHLFAHQLSVGAPPDALSAEGQRWGMPPMVPSQMRADGYQYWRAALAAHLELAGVLRVDHIMGLHRLLWVPQGASADEGAYVQYPADELYAVLALESARAGTPVVGEDLGNVPAVVRRAMEARRIHRLVVARPGRAGAEEDPPAESLVTTGTHDMPLWAAGWEALSPTVRAEWCQAVGLTPRATPREVYHRTVERLARTDPPWLLLNLEDCWMEAVAPNRPGTPSQQNWSRLAARTVDEVVADSALAHWLAAAAAMRPAESAAAEARAGGG